jgi:glycerol-3-phosphate dehydrogenase (NAD(P)+)
MQHTGYNPNYLKTLHFNPAAIQFHTSIQAAIQHTPYVVLAIPATYIQSTFQALTPQHLQHKTIINAVKGILPSTNTLIQDYFTQNYQLPPAQFMGITGPCHAEEVAAQKLSYLTFSGTQSQQTHQVSQWFATPYLHTIQSPNVTGTQLAAILKNVYALGAGIVHGLGYGDNFMSVYITNAAHEMAQLINHILPTNPAQFLTSAYMGDLLVTAYSPHSRNRALGKMLGQGHTITQALAQLNMVAEGYHATQCIHTLNAKWQQPLHIANAIYQIVWQQANAKNTIAQLHPKFK